MDFFTPLQEHEQEVKHPRPGSELMFEAQSIGVVEYADCIFAEE